MTQYHQTINEFCNECVKDELVAAVAQVTAQQLGAQLCGDHRQRDYVN
jgi:hypothetical protein